MRRFPPHVARRAALVRLALGFALAAGLAMTTINAQIPGRNVNMVAGQGWPDGDPFLQRQNEPSIAASTRNPLHLLAGSNDYRTIDLPGLPDEDEDETGDAWLGLFKSVDGGQRWKSGLLPGYPQDKSPEGLASPLKGYEAAADPVVRAGISGLLFYNGLVFDREEDGKSAIFVSRFLDENNQEAGDPITYLGTSLVAKSNGEGGRFLDKPWMAVDLPRGGGKGKCEIPLPAKIKKNGKKSKPKTQKLEIGNIYVAYTSIIGDGAALRSEIYLHVSEDCGKSWGKPQLLSRAADRVNQGAMITIDPSDGDVFVTWRRFGLAAGESDGIMVARLPGGGKANSASWAREFKGKAFKRDREVFEHRKRRVSEAAELDTFDQNTNTVRFRSNAYPTATVDASGRLYVAWSERGFAAKRPDASEGDARIVMVTSNDGQHFTAPVAIDEDPLRPGHQLMPTIAFAGGRLMLVYYDVRETRAQNFGQFVSDAGLSTRQTMDIRAAMGTPGNPPSFAPSVKVSDYLMGFRSANGALEQLQVNPPNLPMFKQGTVPFIGDYIDVTAAPVFVPGPKGKWQYNTATSSTPPVFHAVWTDNRDVRPPLNGDWTQYTPPTSAALGPISLVDPTQAPPVCVPGNAGSRNQNVYSSRITGGLVVGSPGNAKQLSPTLQRAFVVFAQNTTAQTRSFRLRISAQPPGGRASFSQFPLPPFTAQSPAPLTTIDVRVPPRSMAARSVYATSTDPDAQIPVDVFEIATPGAPAPLPGGLASRTVINPDVENPDVENPDVENPDVENPDVENAEVYNPDVENPDVENPDVENPDVENPDVENPDVENVVVANPDIDNVAVGNPDVENPDVENPDVENPDVENPDVENGAIADITWSVKNTGNTTAAFNVNLFLSQTNIPQGLQTQLVIYKTYKTPVTVPNGCELRFETRNVLVTNIPSPRFISPTGGTLPDPNDSSEKNPTLWLAPGEVGRITLRIVDNDTSNNVFIRNAKGELVSIDPVFNPEETDVTPGISSQAVGTEDAAAGVVDPPVVTPTGSNLIFLQQPSNTTINTPIAPPVRVRAFANSGAALAGVTVTMSLNVPGVVLTGGVATTDANGIATFAALQVGTPGDGYILTATVGGSVPASARSSSFDVTLQALSADLVVTQSSTQPIINTNTTITLTVTNNGPAEATGVVLTDTLPAAATFVMVTNESCSYNPDSRTVTCQVGTLAPGVSRTYAIVIQPTALATLTNTVAVAGAQPDQAPGSNASSATTFVSSYAACSSPTFRGPFVHALSTTSAGTLATADFNEDTFPDVIIAEADGNFVLLLSDGLGGFAEPRYIEENNPTGATTADLNSDGHADVVAISTNAPPSSNPAEFGVGLGDGAGNFAGSGQEDINLPLAAAFNVEAGDFNHDGHPDVVVSSGNAADNTVVVLLGVGDGTFNPPISVPAGPTPGNLVLGDFNLDGNLDIAVNNIGFPTVTILRGDGEGGFSAPQTVTLAVNSGRLRRMNDVNGDGAPDLGVTTAPGGGVQGSLLLLLNNGAGNFLPPTEIIGPRGVGFATTADLNGDGRLDVAAILFAENRLVIFDGNGQGQFTESASYLTGTSQNQFAITDLNADGRPDIVGSVGGGYYLLFNTCEGGQGASADLDSTVIGPGTATVGDQLTYTAFIANNGPDPATNVVATFIVPSGMSFVSTSNDCTVLNGTVQCSLPTIAAESNESFTVTVQPFAAGLRVSQLMATATEPDPDASNNVGGANTNVTAGAFTFVVTSTADAGKGTLRQAIADSNLNAGSTNQIHFALTGEAPFTIAPETALPNISVPVIIDGTTQPGYGGVPLIELSGINLATGNGLNINAGNSTVRGLSITRWSSNGISLNTNGNNVVEGNYIGLAPTGVPSSNGNGVSVTSPNNRIGGTTAASRNVISGNLGNGLTINGSPSTTVQGNYIGTDPAGTGVRSNASNGISITNSNGSVIGGATAAARNLISGNGAGGFPGNGITASGTSAGTAIQGNYIGVDVTGNNPLGNRSQGIASTGLGILIGGAGAGEGNVISANGVNNNQIDISSGSATIQGNLIGPNAAGTATFAGSFNGIVLRSSGNIVGGAGNARNIISGHRIGVQIAAGSNNTVVGNRIGTNPAGTSAMGNAESGVAVFSGNNTIGGPGASDGNLLSGNSFAGVLISSAAATGNRVVNNLIGTDATGTSAIANGSGVLIQNSAAGNTIGGTQPGDRNVIAGNGQFGVNITSQDGHNTTNNRVIGNYLGVKADGATSLPNGAYGVRLFANVNSNVTANTIGGSNPGEGNLISGNGLSGVALQGSGTTGNTILGNLIGTSASGLGPLPNATNGVFITDASDNTIGGTGPADGNLIAFNGDNGISMGSGVRNRILGNRIHSNGTLGIDLNTNGPTANDQGDGDSGANFLQNFPVLSNASNLHGATTRVDVNLTSFANGLYTLQFFANAACDPSGNGEGQRLVGHFTGHAAPATSQLFLNEAVPAGQFMTATATDANGNTSEFSACTAVDPANAVVANTNDSGPGSLRQAILDANAGLSAGTITFNIPNEGPYVIQPQTPLPVLRVPMTIDGYTQPGSSPNTLAVGTNAVIQIALRGPGTGGFFVGLNAAFAPATIKGLAIGGFNAGIQITENSTGSSIQGNFIGTDAQGTIAIPNGDGIQVRSPNNVIGGATLAARNLISGNTNNGIRVTDVVFDTVASRATGTVIVNNLIGTTRNGLGAMGNHDGVAVSVADVTIGGVSALERNIIAGNTSFGINSFANVFNGAVTSAPSQLIVQGNYVGVGADGLAAVPNGNTGVNLNGRTTIGGTAGATIGACTGACNVIAGNAGGGIGLNVHHNNGTVYTSAASSQVIGNFIGLNTAGNAMPNGAPPNFSAGINVGVENVLIGGSVPLARNVISGNNGVGVNLAYSFNGAGAIATAAGAIVKGNYIGIGPDGATARGNGQGGLVVTAPNVTIGGETAAERNVISGNNGSAMFVGASMTDPDGPGGQPCCVPLVPPVAGSDIVVRGNYVGTDALGLAAVPNVQGGLNISAPRATVAGNVISGNNQSGLNFGTHHDSTTGQVFASGSNGVVTGNRIGLKATVDQALPNTGGGIGISVPGVTIGGTALADRNVISGNGGTGIGAGASLNDPDGPGPSPSVPFTPPIIPSGLVVTNNYIGTNAAGTVAIPNSQGANLSAPGAIVRNNLISGNSAGGLTLGTHFNSSTGEIYAGANGAIVEGNKIGTNASGNAALPNNSGISVSAPGVTIGGSTPLERNVISGNQGNGVQLFAAISTGQTAVASARFTVIKGNYIGVNAAGTALLANTGSGIASTSANVTIGGLTQDEGNVIAGGQGSQAIGLFQFFNAGVMIDAGGSSTIQNNTLGLNANRDARLNTRVFAAIHVQSAGNQIIQNVIAGNGDAGGFNANGISINNAAATGNSVRGNLIGTNPSGEIGLGNFGAGVSIFAASNNTIGGLLPGDRNVLVGHGFGAITIGAQDSQAANNNTIQGNYIGILPDGITAHNNVGGINLFAANAGELGPGGVISGTVIGGEAPGARNVVSGNFDNGVNISGVGVSNTTIAGNYVGVAADGVTARGNAGNGIHVFDSDGNTIGGSTAAFGNRIANNGSNGVLIQSNAERNQILFNTITGNTFQGIDLVGNANNNQQPAVLSAASNTPGPNTTVTADLPPTATGFTLQFFANIACDATGGEGDRIVGHFTGVSGRSQYTLTETVPNGQFISATITDSLGNTSEFAVCTPVVGGNTPLLVSNTNDSGAGSLRQALIDANAAPGTQTINFNIAGASAGSPAVINLVTPLPAIADPVVIDGASQPGYTTQPIVEINGAAVPPGPNASGLVVPLGASGSTIRGLSITGFSSQGIYLNGSNNSTVEDSWLGVRANGAMLGNGSMGIYVVNASTNTLRRNVIGGNGFAGIYFFGAANGNQVENSKIGTDAAGTAIYSNVRGVGFEGSSSARPTNNTVSGNLISGNLDSGIRWDCGSLCGAVGTQILNNTIGLSAAEAPLPNGMGLQILTGPGTVVTGNTIAGNTREGITINEFGAAPPVVTAIVIKGNKIGVNSSLLIRPNSLGIRVFAGATAIPVTIGGTFGEQNVIRSNTGVGIFAQGPRVSVLGNEIEQNGGLGIDVGPAGVTANDPGDTDGIQNYPVLTAATNTPGPTTHVTFTTSDFAPGTYTLHFYSVVACDASGFGEGERLLSVLNGFVSGGGPFTQPLGELVASGRFVTATATDELGRTSEFSACMEVDPSVALTPNPFAIVTNTSAPMTVTLSHPAGVGGQTVTLVSNDPVAAVQPSIVIAQGASAGTALITTGSAAGSAILTATAAGFRDGTATVNVSLRGMTLGAPSTLVGVGRTLTGTITLAQPAPSGGLAVNLASDSPSFVSVGPATVGIAPGSTTGSFTISGVAAGPATITATATGASTATLNITATTSSLISIGNPPVVAPGQTSGVAVSLGIDAPAGGVTISFTSSDTSVATITPSVFIPAGLKIPAANPQITGGVPGTASITASAAGFAPDTRSVNVTLTLSFTPATGFAVIAARTSNITLNLSSPAPAGGLTLNTSIDNPALATVPATVSVAAGTTSVQVPVTGVAVGTTTVRASGTGIAPATAAVRVDPTPAITIANTTIGKDLEVSMSGSLGLAAPAGGVVVTITSLDPSRVLLATADNVAGSASITRTVTAGSSSIPTFWVQALAGTGTSDIQATATGYANDTSTITMQPSGFILNMGSTFTTTTFAANTSLRVDAALLSPTTLNYQGSQALRGGLTVNVPVTSSDTNVGTIVGSPATFNAGDTVNFGIAFDPVALGTTTISLTTPAGFSTPNNLQSIVATVNAPNVTIANATIGRDLQEGVSVFLGATPPSPVTVTVTSNDGAIATITKDGTVAGGTSLTFTNVTSTTVGTIFVQGRALGSTTLTAQAAGYNGATSNITVNPSGFILNMSSSFTTTTFAANTSLRVDAALLNATTLNYQQSQPLRGGLTVNVAVASSDTNVGTIVGSPATFNAGDTVNFGTAFDPATSGDTTISLTTPAGFTTPNNLQSILAHVNAPNISIASATIGRDLQEAVSVFLGATPPSPVTVTVTSNNGTIATITKDGSVAGGTSLTFTNVTSTTVGTIFVQGRALGSTTLTVQAAGYDDGTSNITVNPSGFILNMSSTFNTTTFAANTSLRVDAALLAPGTLNYQQSQPLRGGLTVTVPVTSSDTNVGTIVGSPATFNAGDTVNFGTAFDPVAQGTSTISLATPAGFQTPSNLQSIAATVSAPNITIASPTIGRDLQEGVSIFLQSAPPSPVTVTVTSNNGTIATITKDGSVAGGTSLTFTNVTSTTVGTIFVQGRALGSTTLTVQAAGYNGGTSNVTVNPSGFILNMSSTFNTTTFAANTSLRVDAALLAPGTLNYQQSQPLRGGLTVTVPVTSSDTNVGTIVGSPATFNAGDTVNFGTAFDPVAQGTSTISLATPAGFHTPSNLQSIAATVSAPNITIASPTIGRDLQEGVSIFLQSAPPSPVTVTVTSNNGTIATITKDGTVAGGTSLTFTNVTSTTVGTIFVQGRALGNTTITVTAPGYVNGVSNVTVGPSGFILNMSNFTTTAGAANTTIRVDAARLNPGILTFAQSQPLRGGFTVNVPVTSSNTSAGTIVGSPAVFNPGDTVNFGTAFDPSAQGSTTISVGTPAGFSTSSNLQSITATVNP